MRRTGLGMMLAITGALALPGAAAAATPPSCTPTAASVAPGGSRSIELLCAYTTFYGSPAPAIVDGPAHGTLGPVDETASRVRYTPAAGFTGEDHFTYSDGSNDTPVRVDLHVTTADQPPVCFATSFDTGYFSSSQTPDLCVDPDETDATALEVVQQPAHGALSLSPGFLSVGYQRDGGYTGADSFTVRARTGDRTSAPVTVTVLAQTAPSCATPPPVTVQTATATQLLGACETAGPFSSGSEVVDEPAHGVVSGGLFTGVPTYTSDDGYTGPDSFTVRTVNAAGASPVVTQRVTVTAEDQPPVCVGGTGTSVRAGASVGFGPYCFDPDGDAVGETFTAAHGAAAFSALAFGATYTADTHFAGTDSVATTVNDGRRSGAPVATAVRILGDGVNTAPTCRAVLPLRIELPVAPFAQPGAAVSCYDEEGDPLSYSVTQPVHGSVDPIVSSSFFGPQLSVHPDPDYRGTDSFTFTASDGHGGRSMPQTVRLELVDAGPAPASAKPQCSPASLSLRVRPGASGEAYAFCFGDVASVATRPAHGTLEEYSSSDVRYTPDTGFVGHDAFSFSATNSAGTTTVPVDVEVTPEANEVPSCYAGAAVTRSAPVTITASCYDEDGDPITMRFGTPAHGTLSAYDADTQSVTYTPAAGFTGKDTFTLDATDARSSADTVTATVRVRGKDVNQRPSCWNGFVTSFTPQDQPVGVRFFCSDADGDPLTYALTAQPAHGTLAPTDDPGSYTYTPDAGFVGRDTFTAVADDGRSQSAPMMEAISVGSADNGGFAPDCRPLSARVVRDEARPLQLLCVGPGLDGTSSVPEISDAPAHGTLSAVGDDGTVTYTPQPGYLGPDRFTYRARSGSSAGGLVEVTLAVVEPAAQTPAPAPVVTVDEPPAPASAPAPGAAAGAPGASAAAPAAPAAAVAPAVRGAEPRSAALGRAAAAVLGGAVTPATDVDLGPAVAAFRRSGQTPAQAVSARKLLALACAGGDCTFKAVETLEVGHRAVKLATQTSLVPSGAAVPIKVKLPKGVRALLGHATRATLRVALTARGSGGVHRDALAMRIALPR